MTGGKLPPAPLTRDEAAGDGWGAGRFDPGRGRRGAPGAGGDDALRDEGYLVDHAADGEVALERIGGRAFDAVICDLKMPRLDGKAFYRTLEADAPELAKRVIFVTGDVAGTDAEEFLMESGCRWLAKPFRLGDLLRALRETLA